jgi:hypothetical protein
MAYNARTTQIFNRARIWLFALLLVLCVNFSIAPNAYGQARLCFTCVCARCTDGDCSDSRNTVIDHHFDGRSLILVHISTQFSEYRAWLRDTFFVDNVLKAMMLMTEQLSAVGMAQMEAVGMLMDAQIQLETQRTVQELQARALKDYHPSENFCYFGTNVRSLSASQHRSEYNKMALNKIALDRETANAAVDGARSAHQDLRARWDLFVERNCLIHNNGFRISEPSMSGLGPLCGSSTDTAVRANADVDYGRMIDSARSLNIDFTNPGDPGPDVPVDITTLNASPNEQDVIALSRNLYNHTPSMRNIPFLNRSGIERLVDFRSVAAKRNVAQNTFNSIVGMKSAGTANLGEDADDRTMPYMASIMQELGVTDLNEIRELLGPNPSYLAQLEVVAKRIYQSPNFYSNLYDKPENVMRTSVALRAIELMLDRTIYESRLRKEMLVSVLLSTRLEADENQYEAIQTKFEELAE